MLKINHYIFIITALICWSEVVFSQSSCIGQAGKIRWYVYHNVERVNVDDLHHNHFFPQGPASFQYLVNTFSPSSYNDYFGSLMKGFFTVPTTGKYAFNVTADDRANFYLSTDDDPANLNLEVATNVYIGSTDFYKTTEQHSDTINLVAGNYYYFELHHKEQTGGDFVRLHWHRPMMADSTWEAIPVNHLYEFDCDNYCPPAGTLCDDGNPNSINDREDGSCNCYGEEPSVLGCVGDRGLVQTLTWTGVSGSSLDDLYADPAYPLMPDTVEFVKLFNHLSQYNMYTADEYGRVIKTFLSVPQTGDYYFNATADDRAKVFLSTDEEPFNMIEVCNTVGGNGQFEHDEYPDQTSGAVSLIKGQYYYMEIHYKENTNTSRYHIFWKTPYDQNQWKVIPNTHLYFYDCETACLPDGTPCDDNDPTTYNDLIIGCNCTGTLCPGGDCTELETYTPYDACDYTGEHTASDDNSWVSCTPAPNPNAARGVSHWILYDFNEVYTLNGINLWNYNVAGSTGSGFKDFVIDISLDGSTWTQFGSSYQLPEAPGINGYTGVTGPNLDGVAAKYVLLTSLTNWDNGACMGISEVSFDAQTCPDAGTPCDDGNPTTMDDMYDSYCLCKGLETPANACAIDTLVIVDDPAFSQTYSAIKHINSNKFVASGSNVSFIAGEDILLEAGFEVELGSNFLATIIPCSASSVQNNKTETDSEHTSSSTNYLESNSKLEDTPFKVYPTPDGKLVYIHLVKEDMEELVLQVTNLMGEEIRRIHENELDGFYERHLDFNALPKGVYQISIHVGSSTFAKRIVLK